MMAPASVHEARRNRRTPAMLRRDRLAALLRRQKHLEARIEAANERGADLSYDKQEASALLWVTSELHRLETENASLRGEIATLRGGW